MNDGKRDTHINTAGSNFAGHTRQRVAKYMQKCELHVEHEPNALDTSDKLDVFAAFRNPPE